MSIDFETAFDTAAEDYDGAAPALYGYGEYQEERPQQDQSQKAEDDGLKGAQLFPEKPDGHRITPLIVFGIIVPEPPLRWHEDPGRRN